MNCFKMNFSESNGYFCFLKISKLNWIFLLFLLATSYTKANSSENNSSEEENGLINDILCPTHHPDFNQGERWRFLLIPGGNCTSHVDLSGRIHLACVGGIHEDWIKRPNHAVRHFLIQKWPLQCFPPSIIFGLFPSLGNLTIENSNFSHFSEDFPSSAIHLKHLRMNGLPKLILKSSLLSDLPVLEELDLRGNSLETLDPRVISSIPRLHKAFVITVRVQGYLIFLLDNKWNCSHHDMRWLSNLSHPHLLLARDRIADYYNLTCQGNMFRGKPLHVVMDLLKSLRLECPPMCRCYLTNLVRSPDMVPEGFAPDSLVPVSTADCRWRKLTELPPSIPSITTVLLLHGNLISSVRPLAQNPALRRLADVYLDDNLVSSLQPLEGADWMLTFRVLSLKGNNITHLPTYAFDNAFQRNKNIGQVFLGQNPWRCDCLFTPAFQELLLKHQKVVVDLPNITCAHSENEEISNTQILILSRSAICRQTTELLQSMDIVNIVLSCLIIFVLGKFAYDYYYFKKKGKLPWIVSKIPY